MLAADPAQPWRTDRPWDPAGEPGDLDRRGRRVLWWGLASAAVLLPWNALSAGRPDLLWPGVVALLDLVPAALLLRGAWMRRTWRRCGAARLRFDRFPFFLGEPFDAVLALDAGTDGRGAVEVTLACIERRPEDGDGTWTDVEVYRASQVILQAGETEVTFELPGPERELGTALGAPLERRWELRVKGRAGARVQAVFPVPVYAPPVDGEAAPG